MQCFEENVKKINYNCSYFQVFALRYDFICWYPSHLCIEHFLLVFLVILNVSKQYSMIKWLQDTTYEAGPARN